MPQIDKQKLSPQVASKYSIVSNAFALAKIKNAELDVYKHEPKDEINVEIGDTKQPEFYPQVKLCRWTNETNFSLRLIDTDYDKALVSTDKDKILWDKGNVKIEFYDFIGDEGGYKMVWYLKAKPPTNKIEFSMQSKGLDFFYQPPMTEEHLEAGQTADETHIYNSEGNVVAERPENVVGSYAVYHSTKGGMNDANGKDYKTGQAFFIYPSHITDAEGKTSKAILKIENGIFSEEIPQKFLDTAVYPIKGNTDFGYTTIGGSVNNFSPTHRVWFGAFEISGTSGGIYSANGNGTVNSITVYTTTASLPFYVAIYTNGGSSTGSLLTYSSSSANSIANNWSPNSVTGASVTSGTAYMLAVYDNQTSSYLKLKYNSNASYKGYQDPSATSTTPPASISLTSNVLGAVTTSIYATYTPSGGGETETTAAARKGTLAFMGVG